MWKLIYSLIEFGQLRKLIFSSSRKRYELATLCSMWLTNDNREHVVTHEWYFIRHFRCLHLLVGAILNFVDISHFYVSCEKRSKIHKVFFFDDENFKNSAEICDISVLSLSPLNNFNNTKYVIFILHKVRPLLIRFMYETLINDRSRIQRASLSMTTFSHFVSRSHSGSPSFRLCVLHESWKMQFNFFLIAA